MPKKQPTTPRSRITQALRQVWLRSRERASALKREAYTCELCGVKQSTAKGREQKLHVHHKKGIDWSGITDLVFERILPDPKDLQVLCPKCHKEIHNNES